jgi:hypothetical protein
MMVAGWLRVVGCAPIAFDQERRARYVNESIDRAIGADRIPEALRVPALLDHSVEKE